MTKKDLTKKDKTENNALDGDAGRRNFLKKAFIGGAGTLLAFSSKALAQAKEGTTQAVQSSSTAAAFPTRIYGKTGVPVSILALGGIFDFVSNQILLKRALDLGITYWDTANSYTNGNSELGIGQFFEKFPDARKKIFLVSKSHQLNREGMTKEFNQSLERLKTDYIDLYCMHGVRDVAKDVTPELMKLAEDLKKQGKIKFFGFSCHENMGECLLAAAKLGGIDGITFMYNYRLFSDEKIKAGIEACFKAGIGLTVIKSQAKGWTSPAEEKEPPLVPFVQKGFSLHQAKLKAIWANEMIASACSAMGNLEILSANAAAAYNKIKLSSEDMHALQLHAQNTCTSYCAGCSNICILALGEDYRIADVMRFMMYHHGYGETGRAREQFAQLPSEIRATVGKIDYTAAERACPQRLAIVRIMREASEILV